MTDVNKMLDLADEYERGLSKMRASGYEEFGPEVQGNHELVIKALRYAAGAMNALTPDVAARPIQSEDIATNPAPRMHFFKPATAQTTQPQADGVREALLDLRPLWRWTESGMDETRVISNENSYLKRADLRAALAALAAQAHPDIDSISGTADDQGLFAQPDDVPQTGKEPVAWRVTDGEGDYVYSTEEPSAGTRAWSRRYSREWEPLCALSRPDRSSEAGK